MLMNGGGQRNQLLISLFLFVALLPKFSSDMVKDVRTSSIYQSLSEWSRGRAPDLHSAVVEADDDELARRVVRNYRLLSRCSGRHVRVTSRHVDAKAAFNDIYSELRIVSETFDSHLRIQSAQTLTYLCFSRNGRLIVRYSGRSPRCVFQELQTAHHFTELRSTFNANWYIGFNRRGKRLRADSWLRLHENDEDLSTDDQKRSRREDSKDKAASGVQLEHRVRHSRRRSRRRRSAAKCREFVKTDVKTMTSRDSESSSNSFGPRLDYQRLYVRLNAADSSEDRPREVERT